MTVAGRFGVQDLLLAGPVISRCRFPALGVGSLIKYKTRVEGLWFQSLGFEVLGLGIRV